MPTPRTQRRALRTFVCLMRGVDALGRRVHAHLGDSELTTSQFAVLEALHHLGPLSQNELGRKILRSPNNMTTVLDNLERRALVRRRTDAEDRRRKLIELTPAGSALIAELFPRHAAVLTAELGALSAREQDELARLCKKLGLNSGD